METRDLRYFLQIAELGSVNAAAERVGRTQPALTKSIKRLEAEIGGKLLVRAGRNVELTPLGEDLLRQAHVICRTVESTVDEMRALAAGERGRVRLGISPTSAHWVLPDVIETFVKEEPRLKFQVVTGSPDTLRNALRTREVDIVIGPEKEEDKTEFPYVDLHDDDVVTAAGPAHPLAGKSATIRDLCEYDWLLPTEDIHTRQWLAEQVVRRGCDLKVRIEATSLLNMRLNIIRGNFLTFIARSDMFFGDRELLRKIKCADLVMRRRIVLLHLQDRPLPPAAVRFTQLLHDLCAAKRLQWSGVPDPHIDN